MRMHVIDTNLSGPSTKLSAFSRIGRFDVELAGKTRALSCILATSLEPTEFAVQYDPRDRLQTSHDFSPMSDSSHYFLATSALPTSPERERFSPPQCSLSFSSISVSLSKRDYTRVKEFCTGLLVAVRENPKADPSEYCSDEEETLGASVYMSAASDFRVTPRSSFSAPETSSVVWVVQASTGAAPSAIAVNFRVNTELSCDLFGGGALVPSLSSSIYARTESFLLLDKAIFRTGLPASCFHLSVGI